MATYTRQSNFSNGDVIDASLFNNEFDQLLAVFALATGHTHDGTDGEGGYIPLISDPTNVTKVAIDVTDPANHKLDFVLDGVTVAQYTETGGLSFTGNTTITGDLSVTGSITSKVTAFSDVNATPVAERYWKWVDIGGGNYEVQYVQIPASDVTFANAGTNIVATDTQAALVELDADLDTLNTTVAGLTVSIDAATAAAQAAQTAAEAAQTAAELAETNAETAETNANAAVTAAQAAQTAAETAKTGAETAESNTAAMLGTKADTTYVDAQDALKADITYVDAQITANKTTYATLMKMGAV